MADEKRHAMKESEEAVMPDVSHSIQSIRHSVAAYRGLWDRFARPNSAAAFRRAFVKGVPCVVDFTAHSIDKEEVVQEVLLRQTTVPVYVKVESLDMANELVDRRQEADNIYVIPVHGRAPGLLDIFSVACGSGYLQCGLYLCLGTPIERLPKVSPVAADEPQVTRGLVLYESVDILQEIEQMQGSYHSDSWVLSCLASVLGEENQYIRVTDLPEGQLLMSQIEG